MDIIRVIALPVRLVAGLVAAAAVPIGLAAAGVARLAVGSVVLVVRAVGPPFVHVVKTLTFTALEVGYLIYGIVATPLVAAADVLWRAARAALSAAVRVTEALVKALTRAADAVERNVVDPAKAGAGFVARKLRELAAYVRDRVLLPTGRLVVRLFTAARDGAARGATAFSDSVLRPMGRLFVAGGHVMEDKVLVPAARVIRQAVMAIANAAKWTAKGTRDHIVVPAANAVTWTAKAIWNHVIVPAADAFTWTATAIWNELIVPAATAARDYIIKPTIAAVSATARFIVRTAEATASFVWNWGVMPPYRAAVAAWSFFVRRIFRPTKGFLVSVVMAVGRFLQTYLLYPAANLIMRISNFVVSTFQYVVTHYSRQLRFAWYAVCIAWFAHVLVFWPFPLNVITIACVSFGAVVVDFILGGRARQDHADIARDGLAGLARAAARDRNAAELLAAGREERLLRLVFGVRPPTRGWADPDASTESFLGLFHRNLRGALADAMSTGILDPELVESCDPAVVIAAPGLTLLRTVEIAEPGALEAVTPPWEFRAMYSRFLSDVVAPYHKLSKSDDSLLLLKKFVIGGEDGLPPARKSDRARARVLAIGKAVVGLAYEITKRPEFKEGLGDDIAAVTETADE
ncbi:hypothetical protein DFJ74DRAFT_711528 [Hyaloraphidium curvatum]|nr:hypothetical protein DFJ74DRAFT_711528 [Hyaloraphidium curvatum]